MSGEVHLIRCIYLTNDCAVPIASLRLRTSFIPSVHIYLDFMLWTYWDKLFIRASGSLFIVASGLHADTKENVKYAEEWAGLILSHSICFI